MKTKRILMFLVTIASLQAAHAQTLEWVVSLGGAGYDQAISCAVDPVGNVYTIGFFEGSCDFDPGVEEFVLNSAGSNDVFISKLDASGNFVWAKRIGGTGNDQGRAIAVDASGNVYATGSFQSTVDFDPGEGSYDFTSAGSSDAFVLKLSTSGDFIWAKQIGGTGVQNGYSIAVDEVQNVYTCGLFQGTVDFDPGDGIFDLNSTDGTLDIFITKWDASGNFVWAKQYAGTGNCFGFSIAVDDVGSVYSTGYFIETTDFDPGENSYNLTAIGNNDIFVAKLDSLGDFVWAKAFGGPGEDEGRSIALDADGNVFTTGYFSGTVDFDPGEATLNLTSSGPHDIFITKLDASGNLLWAKNMGGSGSDFGVSVATDLSGNIYTTGYFYYTADFDPGSTTYNLDSEGSGDIFVSCLDHSGEFVWAKSFGGNNFDVGTSVVVDDLGNIYTTGYFDGTANFDTGSGNTNLTSAGNYDVFVHKMSQSTSIAESSLLEQLIRIFPNPTNGEITIFSEDELHNIQLTVRNTIGQEVYKTRYSSANQIHLNIEGAAGIYFVEILSASDKAVFKILKD